MRIPDSYADPNARIDPFADPPPSPPKSVPTLTATILDNLPPSPEGISFNPSYNLLTILCIVAITLIFIPFLLYWCLYGSCCRRHVWRRYSYYRHKRHGKKEIKKEEMRRHEQLQEEERQRERERENGGGRLRSWSNSMKLAQWKTRGARSFTWSGPPPPGFNGMVHYQNRRQQSEDVINGWRIRNAQDQIPTKQTKKERKWWWQVWFSRHPKQPDIENRGDGGAHYDDVHYLRHDYNRHRRSFLAHLFGGPPSSDSLSPPARNILSTDEDVPPSSLRELSPRPIDEEDALETGTIITHTASFDDSDRSDVDQSSTIRCSTRKILPSASEAIKPQIVPIYARVTSNRPVAVKSVTTGFLPRPYFISKIANRLRSRYLDEAVDIHTQRQLDLQRRATFRSISAPCAIVYRPPTITRKVQPSQHGDDAPSISSGGTTPLDASVPTYSALFAQGLKRRLEYLEEPVVMRQTVDFAMPPMGSTPVAGIVVHQDETTVQQFVEALRRKLEWWKGQTLTGGRDLERDLGGWAYPSARVVGEEEFIRGYFEGQLPELVDEKDPLYEKPNATWKENTNKSRIQVYQLKDARSKAQIYSSHSRRGTELSFRTALSNVSINDVELDYEERGRAKDFNGGWKAGQRERKEGNTDYSPVVLRRAEIGRASERGGIDLG